MKKHIRAFLLLVFALSAFSPVSAEEPTQSKLVLMVNLSDRKTKQVIPGASVSISIFNQQNQKVGGPYLRMTGPKGKARQELSIHGSPRQFFGHYARVDVQAAGYQKKETRLVKWDPSGFKAVGSFHQNKKVSVMKLVPLGAGGSPSRPERRAGKGTGNVRVALSDYNNDTRRFIRAVLDVTEPGWQRGKSGLEKTNIEINTINKWTMGVPVGGKRTLMTKGGEATFFVPKSTSYYLVLKR